MKSGSCVGHPQGRVRVVLAVVFWLAAAPAAWATVYYVDTSHPNARDTNPGTETQPFKTINKATSLVNAGDTVFVKAGVYRETVILSRSGSATGPRTKTGTAPAPITLAAYPGHEGKAIINAAEPVTNWRKCTGPQECAGNPNWQHIYWADVAALVQMHPDKAFAVRQVFQQGVRLPRSRYPDTGWSYPTLIVDPKTTFSDSTLVQPRDHFNGAVCHIKTRMWRIDQIPIANFSGTTITLATDPWYDLSTRFGYYITSVVGEINEEGEWAYDPARKRLYLWPHTDSPADVEFSYRQHCLRSYSGASWNMVRGLTLRNAYTYGIWLFQANDMLLENNTVEHTFDCGIYLQANAGGECHRNQVLGNTVRYCCSFGININSRASNNDIEGNYVYGTGAESFGGDLMNGRGIGMHVSGPYTRVRNNRIDRTGHTALYLMDKAAHREISYNHITNSNLALADGGGIYMGSFGEGPEEDHIHHNLIVDSFGCRTMDKQYDVGTPPTIETYSGDAQGIYVDEEGNNRIIEHNTVIRSRFAGILFHWAPSNLVQKNTLYGNGAAQVWLSGKNEARKTLVDDRVLDNVLFATNAQQKTLNLAINYGNVQFGQSDRNYFYNPYNSWHIFVSRYGGTVQENLTLDGWRELSGYDANSREFSYLEQRNTMVLASPTKSRIVYNTTLEVQTIDLEGNTYCDVEGNPVSGAVVLQPFESKILIATDSEGGVP